MIGYILFIGLSLSSIVTGDITLDPEAVCPLLVYGTNIMDPDACDVYYTCQGESYQKYQCTSNLQYNKDTQKCVVASLGTCQGDANSACVGQSKGTFVADPDSCNGYIHCNGDDTGSLGYCDNNLQFDKTTRSCNYANIVKCTEKTDTTNPSLLCSIVPNNVYFGVREDCSQWARCRNDVYAVGNCTQTGQEFNTQTGMCDYSSQCIQKKGSTSGDPTAPSLQGEACDTAGEFIADDFSCAGYYWCGPSNTWQWSQCTGGKFFDDGYCKDRYTTYCKYDRCVGSSLSWVVDSQDCESYYHCINGTSSLKSYSCGDGKVFNEKSQVCASKIKNAAADPTCTAQVAEPNNPEPENPEPEDPEPEAEEPEPEAEEPEPEK